MRAASTLIRESWSENRETTLDYGVEFLQSCLEYPEQPILTPAIFDDGAPAAMVFGMPRHARLLGEARKLLLMTFFTVGPQWKGRGLGKAVWAACLAEARDAGFDGAIHYCVEGNLSNHAIAKAAAGMGLDAVRILPVRFLQKLLKPAAEGDGESPAAEVFLRAAEAVQAPLTRIWTRAEAEWQIRDRAGALCVTYESGAASGALSGYTIGCLDGTRCFLIEDVLWDGLAPGEQAHLLGRLLASAAEKAEVAAVPMPGYADLSAFRQAGFRLSRRVLNAYLTMWRGAATELRGFYMDVL
jgi:GNAT superfamily N-acetyltransferase